MNNTITDSVADLPVGSVLPTYSVFLIFDGTEPAAISVYDFLDSGVPLDEDGSDKRFVGALYGGKFVEVDLVFTDGEAKTSCSIWSILSDGLPIDDEGDDLEFVRLEEAEC